MAKQEPVSYQTGPTPQGLNFAQTSILPYLAATMKRRQTAASSQADLMKSVYGGLASSGNLGIDASGNITGSNGMQDLKRQKLMLDIKAKEFESTPIAILSKLSGGLANADDFVSMLTDEKGNIDQNRVASMGEVFNKIKMSNADKGAPRATTTPNLMRRGKKIKGQAVIMSGPDRSTGRMVYGLQDGTFVYDDGTPYQGE